MSEKAIERLKAIIQYASELHWLKEPERGRSDDYPTMKLSEVEKCMLAMIDDSELQRLKCWTTENKELSDMMEAYHEKFGTHFNDMQEALKVVIFPIKPESKPSDLLFKKGA